MSTFSVSPKMSNQQFLENFAKPGCIGLAGGTTLIDKAIRRAERHLDPERRWSQWSHAFLFGERRSDGHLWVIESDLLAAHKHVQFGVQENRITKYYDGDLYESLAVLNLNLPEEQTGRLLAAALDLVAMRTRYSLTELLGAYVALRHGTLRQKDNLLSRERSMYCSAFVQHVFQQIGIDLAPNVNAKTNAPEDIARTPIPHDAHLLQRDLGESAVREAASRLRRRVKINVTKAARILKKKSGRRAGSDSSPPR